MTKRILIVEDTEDNRRILRDLLTAAGYEMIEAVTGGGQYGLARDAGGHHGGDAQAFHPQIAVAEAKSLNPEAEIGDFLTDPLPPIDFGRIAAQTAKQVIVQRVREAERKRHYNEYKDRVGEIVNGTVKRTEYGNLMVEIGKAEALLRRDELIQRESFRNGDRVEWSVPALLPDADRVVELAEGA